MTRITSFTGVLPAITTPFHPEGSIDDDFLVAHAKRMVSAGAKAIVPCGSLGEGSTLHFEERVHLVRTLVQGLDGAVPVVPGVAATTTDEAVAYAKAAADAGAGGLMVLPPYVYVGTRQELARHIGAVITATDLPCMLYNNPIAYGSDLDPELVGEAVKSFDNVKALKDSSGDARRLAMLHAKLGDSIQLLVGLDDALVEGVAVGAVGWVAGLVNAFPEVSVALFEAARDGRKEEALRLYRWFLPLLKLDTTPDFVQAIKRVQAAVGLGSETVRAPRTPLAGERAAEVDRVIAAALAEAPDFGVRS